MSSKSKFSIFKHLAAWVIFGFIGYGIGTFYANYTMNRDLPKDYVFQVTSAFSGYQMAVYELQDLWRDKKPSETSTSVEKSNIETYQAAKNQLEQKLTKAKETYGAALTPSADAFLSWLKKQTPENLKQQPWDKWSFQYDDLKSSVYKALQNATGIANIDNRALAAIMLKVPAAKEALKKKPNDPKLCNVMKRWDEVSTLKVKGRELMAQQIAFMEVGDQYCKAYYHKPSAWGALYQPKASAKDKNRYDQMAYAEYYQKVVVPLIPEAKKKAAKGEYSVYQCGRIGAYHDARNPMLDAVIAVYKSDRAKYCPKHAGQPQSYFNTPASCISAAQMMCGPDVQCDILQRCLPVNGALFNR